MNSYNYATHEWSAEFPRPDHQGTYQTDDDRSSLPSDSQPQYSQSQSSYIYYSQSQDANSQSQSLLSQQPHWRMSQQQSQSSHPLPQRLLEESAMDDGQDNDDVDQGDDQRSHSSSKSDSSIPPSHRTGRNNKESRSGSNNNHMGGPPQNETLSPAEVIGRIESTIQSIVKALATEQLPELTTFSVSDEDGDDDMDSSEDDNEDVDNITALLRPDVSSSNKAKRFVFHNMTQCRMFSSILLVLSFCHSLLLAQRTTTTREVYYFYVTHFRSQKECDAAIVEATNLLQIPRASLGLYASPKGWFCGCIQIIRDGRVVMDGQSLSSMQGNPITQEWLRPVSQRNFTVDCLVDPAADGGDVDADDDDDDSQDEPPRRRAKCILVIEKEGVYNRFSEDRLYERYPCILVTGKGFPDLATRSLVHSLHHELQLPVYGIADCNPYGVLVLQTYQYGSERRGVDGGSRYAVPIQWLGLRPSQVEQIQDDSGGAPLPAGVYQSLTELDQKRLQQLLHESHRFHDGGNNQERYEELETMEDNGYKMELEALNWLGMDYLANWVHEILVRHKEQLREDASIQTEEDQDSYHSQDQVSEENGDAEGGDDASAPLRIPAII